MTESQIITRYVGALKDQMAEIAEDAMLRPKKELFDLGNVAGRYQGLHEAHEILSAILRDEYQNEINS